jgi:predicted kinase
MLHSQVYRLMSQKNKNLFLLRGLPGSGKSTLADALSEEGKYPVYSIDSYFTNAEGYYNFEFDKNHIAYKECLQKVELSMGEKVSKIFVDNTFTLEWEMEPYFQLAEKYSYRIFVLTVENRHRGINIHHVSEEQLKKMAEKFKVRLLP